MGAVMPAMSAGSLALGGGALLRRVPSDIRRYALDPGSRSGAVGRGRRIAQLSPKRRPDAGRRPAEGRCS